MAILPETKLFTACKQWIKSVGGDCFHVHGSSLQRAGEPDVDGWIPLADGNFLHLKIELKMPHGVVSPLQKIRLDRYGKVGYTVGVVHSTDELKELIENAARIRSTSIATKTSS